jgi:hypothetical protein
MSKFFLNNQSLNINDFELFRNGVIMNKVYLTENEIEQILSCIVKIF